MACDIIKHNLGLHKCGPPVAWLFDGQYTVIPSWLVEEGRLFENNGRTIYAHPYDYVRMWHLQMKDSERAAELLRQFLHVRIDQLFKRRL